MESNNQILPKGYELKSHSQTYTIERKLGQGGFGITYLASFTQRVKAQVAGNLSSFDEDAEQQIKVVVKEFYIKDISSRNESTAMVTFGSSTGQGRLVDSFKQKMRKEAGFLSQLQHPNIAKVSEIFEANNTVYIVMQYIRGESLLDRINQLKKIPVNDAIKYILQICDALEEVHRNKILHLDIKPGNILLDKQDNAKLIDFGVSKQYNDKNEETSHSVLGKSDGYAPIEQYEESGLASFSSSIDIYALGATLYCMLTGVKPIPAPARMHTEFDAPITLNPEIPQALSDVVMKAMDIFAKKRYQSAVEFKTAIEDVSRQQDEEDKEWMSQQDFLEEGFPKAVANYLTDYIEKYPAGKHTEEAKEQLEGYWVGQAVIENTIQSYQRYLEKYPTGKHAQLFKERITELKRAIKGIKVEPQPGNNTQVDPLKPQPSVKKRKTDADEKKPKTGKIAVIIIGAITGLVALFFLVGTNNPNDPINNDNPELIIDACSESAENVTFEIAGEKYTYSGEWYRSPSYTLDQSLYDCVPNGKGKAVFEDGRVYEGNFANGIRSGKGKMTFKDGSYYEGEVKNNRAAGTGSYHWKDGTYYNGTWENDNYLDGSIYDRSGALLTVYRTGRKSD
jgi:serine/threonine protein kinase